MENGEPLGRLGFILVSMGRQNVRKLQDDHIMPLCAFACKPVCRLDHKTRLFHR